MDQREEHTTFPYIVPAGDSAALIRFGSELDLTTNAAVLEFDHHLQTLSLEGVLEVSPAIVSLLVRFDPLIVSYQHIVKQLQKLLTIKDWLQAPVVTSAASWKLPVLYGHDAGTDLNAVADLLSLSADAVIEQHSNCVLRVLTLGFAPGCAYLGMLPQNWDIPRLKVIKPQVPAGSILVAIRQTVMPSAAMPTGWRCIGRTPLINFSIHNYPPVAVQHGDKVQYAPVSMREFKQLQSQQAQGKSVIEQVA